MLKFCSFTAVVIALAFVVPAMGAPIGFAGLYAPGNWTVGNANGPGLGSLTVDFSGAPGSAVIHGDWGGVSFVMTAPVSGTVSLTYDLTNAANGWFYYTTGGYGPWIPIGKVDGIGTFSFNVTAGEVFGFDVGGSCGGCVDTATITNFDVSAPSPEPSSLGLIGIGGLVLAGLIRRRRA